MSKVRADWDKLFRYVALAGMACAGSYFALDFLEDNINGQTLSSPVIEQGGSSYRFIGDNILLKKAGKLSHAFDFAARHIIIEGELDNEKFTGYATFEGFGRPAEIADANAAGCVLAQEWGARAQSFNPGYINPPTKADTKQAVANSTSAFIRDYCTP